MSGRDNSRAEGGQLSARLVILVCALVLAACGEREQSLAFEDGVIRASDWSGPEPEAGWESVLVVRTGDDPDAPPLLGDYKKSGDAIIFTPRFPPSAGVELHVSFTDESKQTHSEIFGQAPDALASTTHVARIYPSTDEWPANTLKMYVVFSAPMASGDAYTHIRVLDDQGRIIEGPFVEIEPELWDPTATRLTLLFDPGRIKRGLVDNESSGPPLMPGRSVTIEIDPMMRDARGAPLAEKFARTIRVVAAVREPVDVKAWRVDSPKSPDDDLMIHFPRPLDHALAQRAIGVSRNGSSIAGTIVLGDDETSLRFTPHAPWTSGLYEIVVDGVIEDVAGNRLGKVFDVDTSDPRQATSATPLATIPFEVPAR